MVAYVKNITNAAYSNLENVKNKQKFLTFFNEP